MKKTYFRVCPKCSKEVVCKSSSTYHYAVRHQQPCKKCSANAVAKAKAEQNEKESLPIFGYIPRSRKIYYRWRRIWREKLTEEDRQKVLSKTPQQKKYFWGHISRFTWNKGLKNIRKGMEKYRGDNHWVKRPEVLAKIKKSCEKYRGDHHWFRLGYAKPNPVCFRFPEAARVARRKPVYQIDKNGNIVKKFNSIIEASKESGIHKSCISQVCRKLYNYAGEYQWRYVSDTKV